MTKKEIDSKFDEIVEFSEIGQFLDTPVKRYSSGMYVRLAFAVAAHLEPEVLFVDEVLAVGDYKFQRKCIEKMSKVSQEGRTVLFVSHNMASVARLCNRSVLLEKGRLIMEGPTPDVIEKYIGLRENIGAEVSWKDPASAPGDLVAKLKSIRMLSESYEPNYKLEVGKDLFIELAFWNFMEGEKLLQSVRIVNNEGIIVLTASNLPSVCLSTDAWYDRPSRKGLFRSVCKIPGNLLKEGYYFVTVVVENLSGAIDSDAHIYEENIISFEIIDKDSIYKEHAKSLAGIVQPRLDWKTEYQGDIK
jgi:lipopolysaccharide transport system ATP-binding protein